MTYIIAEIGINHNGDIRIATDLIKAAKAAGADAVKFQKRTVEIVYAGHIDDPRESPWGTTLGQQKNGLEFGQIDYNVIDYVCRTEGIAWSASAWDKQSLSFLASYNLPWNKVASAMATNLDFLAAVNAQRKPVYLSTGMCTFADIEAAMQALKDCEITLMHCVGTYPCREEDLNLAMIGVLEAKYGLPVGYSGHEASVSPSVIAAAIGAVAVERHITLDRSMYGSDQAASLEPHGFETMVAQIRKLPVIMGDGVKRITEDEAKVAKKLRYWG